MIWAIAKANEGKIIKAKEGNMARILTFVVLSAAVCLSAPPTSNYRLVWSDEFDGTEMDGSKWGYTSLGPRVDGVNVREAIEVGDGNLRIIISQVGNEYHSGMISTRGNFEPTYGYFEARVRLQKTVGFWSAFWLQSPSISRVGDTRANGTEVDIYEYRMSAPYVLMHNMHWDGYGSDHKWTGVSPFHANINDLQFHTVGLEWTPDRWTFYVDDHVTWSTDTAPSNRSEYILLSAEVGTWAGLISEAVLPDTVLFDYVRVYQSTGQDTDPRMAPYDYALLFNAAAGGNSPPPKGNLITNISQGTLGPVTTSIEYLQGDGWLSTTVPGTGGNEQNVVSTVDITGLEAGSYQATVTVHSTNADPIVYQVHLFLRPGATDASHVSTTPSRHSAQIRRSAAGLTFYPPEHAPGMPADIAVVNGQGALVKRLAVSRAGGSYHWDGRNGSGAEVPSGLYLVVVQGNQALSVPFIWVPGR
jgi:beta-glucanase (GH16 family)